MSRRRPALPVLAVLLVLLGGTERTRAQGENPPPGFLFEPVITGIFEPGRPVGFAHLPDGRVLLVERNTGFVRVHVPGSATAPVRYIVPDVAIEAERGLLGVAVDPAWPARPYVYLYYTHTSHFGRVEMLTASGDLSDPGSASVTLGSPYLLLDDLPDALNIHNGGTLRFGPDGMLYLSLGDDGAACNAQDPAILAGAILRLDVSSMPGAGGGPPPKADLVPAGNPFPGPGDAERLVWVTGLRNPYRFTIDPLTNDLAIGDVGLTSFEEIDVVRYATDAGANYGWPHREGFVDPGLGWSCGAGATFTDPAYVYAHLFGAAIVAGPIYRAPAGGAHAFPPEYEGSLFFGDFYQAFLRRLVFDGAQWVLAPPVPGQPSADDWGTGFAYYADMQTGPDGAIHLLRLFPSGGRTSGLYRIVPDPAVGAPEPVAAAGASGAGRVTAVPNPAIAGAGVDLVWDAPRRGPATVHLVDAGGRSLRRWIVDATDPVARVRWDGRAAGGRPVPPGVYFVRVESEGDVARGRAVLVR